MLGMDIGSKNRAGKSFMHVSQGDRSGANNRAGQAKQRKARVTKEKKQTPLPFSPQPRQKSDPRRQLHKRLSWRRLCGHTHFRMSPPVPVPFCSFSGLGHRPPSRAAPIPSSLHHRPHPGACPLRIARCALRSQAGMHVSVGLVCADSRASLYRPTNPALL